MDHQRSTKILTARIVATAKKGCHFSIINQMGCGDAFEGVAVGADMYHVQKVRAFIGPYCNTGK